MLKVSTIFKLVFFLAVIFILLNIFCVTDSLAISFDPSSYKPSSTTEVTGSAEMQRIGSIAIGAVRAVASIVSVIVLIVIGIKYLIGSVEEKAEYKKTMLPYVIGAFMVFSINIIIEIIANIAKGLL